MKNNICFVFVLFNFLTMSCATTYRGSGPNLEATGQSALEEFKKFRIVKIGGNYSVFMGDELNQYTINSITPIVKGVSLESYDYFVKSNNWSSLQNIAFYIGLSSFALYLVNSKYDNFGSIALGSSLISIGLAFTWQGDLEKGIQLYNQTLKERLKSNYKLQNSNQK